MANMVICKSCGYITEQGKLRDRCPACGVPTKMFQPHDERISPRRKMLLSLDIHPVMVHFPQAFTATLLLLSVAGCIFHGATGSLIAPTARTLAVLLPFTLLTAFFSGMFDGKIRFRKVTTPLLKRKMLLGAMFFLLGCAMMACALILPMGSTAFYCSIIAISLPALGCTTVLSLIGTSLLHARFPG